MRRLLSRDNTPPPTTFDHFFSLCSVRQTPPQTCGLRRISVFVRVVSAMRAPHHTPIRIKALDVSPPGQTSALGIVHPPENRRFPAASTRVSLGTNLEAPPFGRGGKVRPAAGRRILC